MCNALKKEATGATEAERPSMADALGAQAATIAELGPTPVDDGRNASPEPIARSLRASASKDSDLTVVKEILQHALLKTGIRKDPEPIAIDLQERLQQLNINTALQLCHALELAGPAALEFTDLRTVIKGPLVAALEAQGRVADLDLSGTGLGP